MVCYSHFFEQFSNGNTFDLDTIKYDVEFIEEEIHQPKRLHRFLLPEQIDSSFSKNVTIECCIIEFNCSDDISSFQRNIL